MAQWRCKHCETWRPAAESKKAHIEICGGLTDDQAEMLPEDYDPAEEPEDREDWTMFRE